MYKQICHAAKHGQTHQTVDWLIVCGGMRRYHNGESDRQKSDLARLFIPAGTRCRCMVFDLRICVDHTRRRRREAPCAAVTKEHLQQIMEFPAVFADRQENWYDNGNYHLRRSRNRQRRNVMIGNLTW